jgi:glycosyltransferase involved in cell wall biosynthesis
MNPVQRSENISTPRISIVTPSYNQGDFIRYTIESILAQDYPHFEYWVIDGGSTDGTVAILQEYEHDERFHWISEPDQGQSNALNKGIARCNGDIFYWLNSDDVMLPGALRQVAATWTSLSQPGIIYGLARLIDQDGTDLGYCPLQKANLTIKEIVGLRKMLMQPATFVPMATVHAVGGIDETLHYTMDLDLWIKIAQRVPITYIPHDLCQFRIHSSSKTISLSTKFIRDVEQALSHAVQQGILAQKDATTAKNIFAIKVYLTPEVRDFRSALQLSKQTIRADLKTIPEIAFAFAKCVVRLVGGEQMWQKARLLRTIPAKIRVLYS